MLESVVDLKVDLERVIVDYGIGFSFRVGFISGVRVGINGVGVDGFGFGVEVGFSFLVGIGVGFSFEVSVNVYNNY